MKLVTLGHLLMDISIYVKSYPKPDEASVVGEFRYGGGGSASNVAVVASRLGIPTGFIGSIGFDDFGRILLEGLLKEGVDITHVKVVVGEQSGTSFVIVDERGRVMIFEYLGASESIDPSDLDPAYLRRAEFLHITSFRFDVSVSAAKLAKEGGVKVSFDPGRVEVSKGLKGLSPLLKYCDVVMLNELEVRKLSGVDDPLKGAGKVMNYGPDTVVVKRGGKGAMVLTKEGKIYSCKAFKVKVVDTTGAGDSFAGGFLSSLIRGEGLDEALRFANAVAALKVTRRGARSSPTRSEVERFLSER